MDDDSLHAPLKPRGLRERLRNGVSPALAAFAIVLVAVAAALVWAWLQPAPLPSPEVVERVLPPRPTVAARAGRDVRPPLAGQGKVPSRPLAMPADGVRQSRGDLRIIDVSRLPEGKPPGERAGAAVDGVLSTQALPPAPLPGLAQSTPLGLLPKRGAHGKVPWLAYAKPVPQALLHTPKPKIAVIVSGLGLNMATTEAAINELPGEVSLAFAPHVKRVARLAAHARRRGHEFFLQLPMEPWGYPAINPGPNTLLADPSADANEKRLRWLLTRAVGYAGVLTYAGQKLLKRGEALAPILHELKRRGLLVVDDGSTPDSLLPSLGLVVGLPVLRADVRILPTGDAAVVEEKLSAAEDIARRRGRALVVISAGDAALERLREWLTALRADGGIVLLPATALARLQRVGKGP